MYKWELGFEKFLFQISLPSPLRYADGVPLLQTPHVIPPPPFQPPAQIVSMNGMILYPRMLPQALYPPQQLSPQQMVRLSCPHIWVSLLSIGSKLFLILSSSCKVKKINCAVYISYPIYSFMSFLHHMLPMLLFVWCPIRRIMAIISSMR